MTDAIPRPPQTDDPGRPRSSMVPLRPAHLTWSNIGLVAVGGTVGTGLRYLIASGVPLWASVPIGTLGVNVVGAFLLGMLLELLVLSNVDSDRSRRLRLLIGTGGLGGFTTYSALATDTATLLDAHPGRAVGYAIATVVLGGLATVAGIWCSRFRARRTAHRASPRQ